MVPSRTSLNSDMGPGYAIHYYGKAEGPTKRRIPELFVSMTLARVPDEFSDLFPVLASHGVSQYVTIIVTLLLFYTRFLPKHVLLLSTLCVPALHTNNHCIPACKPAALISVLFDSVQDLGCSWFSLIFPSATEIEDWHLRLLWWHVRKLKLKL